MKNVDRFDSKRLATELGVESYHGKICAMSNRSQIERRSRHQNREWYKSWWERLGKKCDLFVAQGSGSSAEFCI